MATGDISKPVRFGLFDSGVGGLSVLRRLHQLASLCPDNEFEFVYLGDTARCPYGNREPGEIREFISQIVAYLAGHGVDHIVMACNTSAAVGLEHAREVSPVPIHNLISPTAKFVASNFRKIGVMATQSTVNSRAFSKKITYYAPQAEVMEIGCPKLVPLVETGEVYTDNVKATLMEYTSQLESAEVEAIILGCTHFAFLAKAIRDLLPSSVALIDPAEMLVKQLVHDLQLNVTAEQMAAPMPEIHCHHAGAIYTTGSPSAFAQVAAACLGRSGASLLPNGEVQMLPLEVLRSGVVSRDDVVEQVLPSNVVPLQPKSPPDSKIVAP